ncbi:MAG: thiamine pyrophosphate-dependent enzyme [Acidimicrobiales bacterium]
MLRLMISARTYSSRLFSLQRQGRIGTMAPIDGNEAVCAGATFALDPAIDWVFPQYREGVALGHFGDEVIDGHVLYQFGHPQGARYPESVRVFPIQISLAAQLPHAVGMAWGNQIQGVGGCSLVFFGDGSSSEGDFYEAGNLAGVVKAPVIFLLVNNQWAISTPASIQSAAATFAEKADAFGFPGLRVDGRDPVAVWEAVSAARARAVAGEGPTLIEAVTYRLGPHTTADDPTRYVPADELAEARANDPLVTYRARLTELGLWDDERQAEAESAARARMDLAVERAEAALAELAPDAFFDHVFAEPTPRQLRQRAALRAFLAEEGRGD